MTRILTIGTFDPWHHGHTRLITRMAAYGIVCVAVNADQFIREYKNREPFHDEHTRALAAQRIPPVAHVYVHRSGWDARPTVLLAEADIVAVGSDWAPPNNYAAQTQLDGQWLSDHGIALLFLPRTPGVSSEELRHG